MSKLDKDVGCCTGERDKWCICWFPLRERANIINIHLIAVTIMLTFFFGVGLYVPADRAKPFVTRMLKELVKNSSSSTSTTKAELKSLLVELETIIRLVWIAFIACGSSLVVTSITYPITCCISQRRPSKYYGVLFLWIIIHLLATPALIYVWIHALIILVSRKDIESPEILKNERLWETLSRSTRSKNTGQGMRDHLIITVILMAFLLPLFVYGTYTYIKFTYFVVQERSSEPGEVSEGQHEVEHQKNPAVLHLPVVQPLNSYAPNPYAVNLYAENPYAPDPSYAPNPYAPDPSYAPNPYALDPYAPNPYAAIPHAPALHATHPNLLNPASSYPDITDTDQE